MEFIRHSCGGQIILFFFYSEICVICGKEIKNYFHQGCLKKRIPATRSQGFTGKKLIWSPKLKLFSAFPDTPEEAPLSILPGITNPQGRTPETGVNFIVVELPTKNHSRPGTAKLPLLHLLTQSLKYKLQPAKSE